MTDSCAILFIKPLAMLSAGSAIYHQYIIVSLFLTFYLNSWDLEIIHKYMYLEYQILLAINLKRISENFIIHNRSS